MRTLAILLKSSWYGWTNGFRYGSNEKRKKVVEIIGFFVLIAALYWLGRALFGAAEMQLGDPTIISTINIFMTLGVCVIIKDAMAGAMKQLYEAPDTFLLLSSPLPPSVVFGFKFIQIVTGNSLSMVIWIFPPWFALGQLFHMPWHFYLALLPACFCLLVIVVSAISILTMLIVRFFSSGLMIRILKILGSTIGLAAGFLIAVSFLAPDLAAQFALVRLKVPESDWFPHVWVAKMMMAWLPESKMYALRWAAQLLGVGAGVSVLSVLAASKIFYRSWEYARRVEMKADRKGKKRSGKANFFIGRGQIRAMLVKDFRVFVRDRKQVTTVVILTLIVLVSMVPAASEIRDSGGAERGVVIPLYIGLGFQIMIISVMATLGFTWGGFKAEAKTWWILKSGPIAHESLFRSKILIATCCSVVYTNVWFFMWLNLFRVSFELWLPILIVTTITTTAVISFNTAMGALPWVAEIGESYRDSRRMPVTRIATIFFAIAGNAVLLSPVLVWGVVVLGGESISVLKLLGIAATLVVLIGVWGLSYLSGKRSLRKLLG